MFDKNVIFRYRTMRKVIGWTALSLPLVSWLIFLLVQNKPFNFFPLSISATYHFGARDIFVGQLFVVASFLFAYNGYRHEKDRYHYEKIFAKVGALLAIIIALVPTRVSENWIGENGLVKKGDICEFITETGDKLYCYNYQTTATFYIHFSCAILLIVILCFFCFRFIHRAKDKIREIEQKEHVANEFEIVKVNRRIKTYYICGIGMVLSIVVGAFFVKFGVENNTAVFWVEVFCLWLFGWSWLTAGKPFPFYSAGEDAENALSESISSHYHE